MLGLCVSTNGLYIILTLTADNTLLDALCTHTANNISKKGADLPVRQGQSSSINIECSIPYWDKNSWHYNQRFNSDLNMANSWNLIASDQIKEQSMSPWFLQSTVTKLFLHETQSCWTHPLWSLCHYAVSPKSYTQSLNYCRNIINIWWSTDRTLTGK